MKKDAIKIEEDIKKIINKHYRRQPEEYLGEIAKVIGKNKDDLMVVHVTDYREYYVLDIKNNEEELVQFEIEAETYEAGDVYCYIDRQIQNSISITQERYKELLRKEEIADIIRLTNCSYYDANKVVNHYKLKESE